MRNGFKKIIYLLKKPVISLRPIHLIKKPFISLRTIYLPEK